MDLGDRVVFKKDPKLTVYTITGISSGQVSVEHPVLGFTTSWVNEEDVMVVAPLNDTDYGRML